MNSLLTYMATCCAYLPSAYSDPVAELLVGLSEDAHALPASLSLKDRVCCKGKNWGRPKTRKRCRKKYRKDTMMCPAIPSLFLKGFCGLAYCWAGNRRNRAKVNVLLEECCQFSCFSVNQSLTPLARTPGLCYIVSTWLPICPCSSVKHILLHFLKQLVYKFSFQQFWAIRPSTLLTCLIIQSFISGEFKIMPKSQEMKMSFLPNLTPCLQSFTTYNAVLMILMRNKSRFSQPFLISLGYLYIKLKRWNLGLYTKGTVSVG